MDEMLTHLNRRPVFFKRSCRAFSALERWRPPGQSAAPQGPQQGPRPIAGPGGSHGPNGGVADSLDGARDEAKAAFRAAESQQNASQKYLKFQLPRAPCAACSNF
jgi:hypothetical protein